ncbi:arylamine N-acetyltransferase [Paenibacillus sp. LHD-117]|uniref:arylamine N-acetyltransferase family protein n=1 Tax=Paenibacillus sp. LHD-117 TaxID=3071412 RepID=UPI0027DF667F|nr:arylamine N-acetyltransferase [Paenibacillus sp. LHD-117]MDQ6422423.1 arylamine N-acetyltransferase [Paenibacillus sp. LHD-117]
MNVQAYLRRIGFNGEPDGSAETLGKLQELHLQSVPYENLDIIHGLPLSLQVEPIYRKIVERRRGGYCFELNALFGWLLRELGYGVTDYFARFWRDETDTPPKRRHHVLRVEAEGKLYLCDVGVGGIVPRRPLLLLEGLEQRQGDELYRFDRDPEFGWMLMEQKKEGWSRLFSFTEEPQLAKDYLMASYWCEHAPDSVFKNNLIVAIHTKEGRNTVWNEEFRLFRPDGVHAFTPASKAEDAEALKTYFGIESDDGGA